MGIKVDEQEVEIVNIRYAGKSHNIQAIQLINLSKEFTQQDLFSAIENNLDLTSGALNGYQLDIEATTAIIRPQTRFEI